MERRGRSSGIDRFNLPMEEAVDPIVVPEDLSELSDEDLAAARDALKVAASELTDAAKSDDEALASLQALAADYNRVKAEQETRSEQASERELAATEALSVFDAESVVDEEVEVEETVEVVAETEEVTESEVETEPVAASVETVEEFASEAETETEVEVEVEIVDEVEEVEEVQEPEVVETATVEHTEELGSQEDPMTTPNVASVPEGAELADRVPADAEPQPSPVKPFAVMRAGNGSVTAERGGEVDFAGIARELCERHAHLGRIPANTYERIVVASAKGDFAYDLSGMSPEQTFVSMESIRREWTEAVEADVHANGLVASGGNCAPLSPSYDFFRLAEELNPVERSLPVAAAPRGGIRFITPVDYTHASAGVRVTTEAEDAEGYTSEEDPPGDGSTDPKPCVRFDCPDVEECRVDAVSKCATWGNLNFRVFPEQVEAFMADLGVIFVQEKEEFYLDAIDAASVAATSAPAYGATRGIVQDLAISAANYRRRHHMRESAVLNVMLPSWVIELVKVDMVNDHSLGLSFLGADGATVAREIARSLNLAVTWYYDSAAGAGQAFNGAQAAGALNDFPTTVVSYLFAPGTFVRLDAGVLDVGIVRDSTLNGQNALQLFSEQWVQVCMVGLESIRIEHTLCPDGTAPEAVTPLVCGS